jgi:hypothetical protein
MHILNFTISVMNSAFPRRIYMYIPVLVQTLFLFIVHTPMFYVYTYLNIWI